MEPVYRTIVNLCMAAFRLRKWDLRVTGGEHVPESGGAIIASNHISYVDFVFVGAAVRRATRTKRLVRFAAKKEAFDHRISGPLMRAMKHVPVDRKGNPAASVRESVRHLKAGELVGMFPEATVSPSYVPLEAKSGTARMAQMAGVPIIPTAVWGCQRLYPKGRPRDLRRDVVVEVAFGAPIVTTRGDDDKAVTETLMATIGELLAAAQERYPQHPAEGEDPWWLPAHLGGTAPTVAEGERIAAEARARDRGQAASEPDAGA